MFRAINDVRAQKSHARNRPRGALRRFLAEYSDLGVNQKAAKGDAAPPRWRGSPL